MAKKKVSGSTFIVQVNDWLLKTSPMVSWMETLLFFRMEEFKVSKTGRVEVLRIQVSIFTTTRKLRRKDCTNIAKMRVNGNIIIKWND